MNLFLEATEEVCLKNGSVISSHNTCLCPLMLLALILIRVFLLSTSSLSSKTHMLRKNIWWESWKSLYLLAPLFLSQSCVICPIALGKNVTITQLDATSCCVYYQTLSFLFVSCSHRSVEERKLRRNPPILLGKAINRHSYSFLTFSSKQWFNCAQDSEEKPGVD